MNKIIELHVLPRQSMTWNGFVTQTPVNSIALDGVVLGGPRFDEKTRHINFDHHDGVVREATMSTAKQVLYAIKGGLMLTFGSDKVHVFINDTDQDTSLAVWLLNNYKLFDGVQSHPQVNRIIELTDRWDITGGGFPTNLNESVIRQHKWIFEPYADLRKSGMLARADQNVLTDNLVAVMARLTDLLMGQAQERELDTRHIILYDSPRFKIIDEIGGNDARYYLFSRGLNAFISIVARRPDGNLVCSLGRRSRFISYPVNKLYVRFNNYEFPGQVIDQQNCWGGSDIVGGSPRQTGTKSNWETLRDLTNQELDCQ